MILAAGFSTRMGTCKTTLRWHNQQTLLRYQVEQLLQANITPIVILGAHNAHRQIDCPSGSRVVVKSDKARSKTSSVLTGLAALPQKFSTVMISAVDQPRSTDIYQTLLQNYQQHKALITAPCYRGKMGHPLLFSHQLLPNLKAIRESTLGLRDLTQTLSSKIKRVEFLTPEILIDINDRKAYLHHSVNHFA